MPVYAFLKVKTKYIKPDTNHKRLNAGDSKVRLMERRLQRLVNPGSKYHDLAFTIVWEHWPDTPELLTWTNALQNRR